MGKAMMQVGRIGVERDRQIAELRGECDCKSENVKCRIICKGKPYSTDISAAMELLDGMRYEYAEIEITHLRTDEQWLIRPFKEDGDVMHDNFEFEVRELTLQGAISGAWLRHKGGNNG